MLHRKGVRIAYVRRGSMLSKNSSFCLALTFPAST
jgi:hypothetical protein